ncbi:uncharacterized protein LOC117175928 [Belonocnema kinseyi]|uniref:uncharacterized protein LOC117175928 n=1 Tax=Belonocnema kinseyi TaxID=2817044 RepID=UPI00143D06FB|nr:uncharacterized protein LOC117175928 [Belonocnema kinseyi]
MEELEVIPPKLRRVQSRMHVSECVRKFTLPQQFPSTVVGHTPVPREHSISSPNPSRNVTENSTLATTNKRKSIQRLMQCPEEKSSSIKAPSVTERALALPGSQTVATINKKNIIRRFIRPHKIIQVSSPSAANEVKIVQKPISAPTFSNGMKIIQKASSSHLLSGFKNPVSSTIGEPQTKLQKLKLKSPDGKDLGEFEVQVVEQQVGNHLKRKLVTVSKHVPKKDESQGSAVVSSTQGESMVAYSTNDVQYPGMIYQEPRIGKVGSEPTKPNIISQISLRGTAGVPIGQVMKNLQHKVITIEKSNVHPSTIPWIKMDAKRVSSNGKKVLYLQHDEHPYLKNITHPGKPISLKPLKSIKLQSMGLGKKAAVEENSDLSMGTGGLKFFQNGDFDEEFEDGELKNYVERNLIQVEQGKKNVPAGTSSRQSYSGSSSDMGSLQYSDEEDEPGSSDTPDTDDSLESFRRPEAEEPPERNLHKSRQRIPEKIKVENLVQKSAENGEGSSDMRILERALASVKDKSLREEALKVLATCKLGSERYVPVRPPPDSISVRETTTQTNIFGSLEPNCEEFVEVKEEVKGLRRIKKEQRNPSLFSKSCNAILTPVDENHTGDQYTKQLDSMLGNLDLDMAGVQEVNQIKEVLNKPFRSNERMNRIRNQIQKDVKMLSDYDENGLMGLHKAVMEDNSVAVKRLLMILKISKKDVDMKTLDGKTSLELALKTDAGPDIVNALLEAGANPTSEETGHDSALIIASKNSSPLLPELLRYAKGQALGSMDSDVYSLCLNIMTCLA